MIARPLPTSQSLTASSDVTDTMRFPSGEMATLLITCLAFLAVGWTGNSYYVTALSVGAVVCIACSNGGTTSQDLKTGYLVGGTRSKP